MWGGGRTSGWWAGGSVGRGDRSLTYVRRTEGGGAPQGLASHALRPAPERGGGGNDRGSSYKEVKKVGAKEIRSIRAANGAMFYLS